MLIAALGLAVAIVAKLAVQVTPCPPQSCAPIPAAPPFPGLEWLQGLSIDDLQRQVSALGGHLEPDPERSPAVLGTNYRAGPCTLYFTLVRRVFGGEYRVEIVLILNKSESDILQSGEATACIKQIGFFRPAPQR